MGKLKEKLLNNLTPEEMDEQYELSAFEYVELMSKYKNKNEEEYIPTQDEISDMEKMVKEYYNSKEFREYVENYMSTDEYVNGLTDEQIDGAIAEHNLDEDELERINDSIQLKYTDSDILYVLDGIVDPQKIDVIKDKLNEVWNTKRGLF
jgi:hypothetical protein